MEGLKGRILKKLKSIPQVGYLTHSSGRPHAFHGSPPPLHQPPQPPHSGRALCELPLCRSAQRDGKHVGDEDQHPHWHRHKPPPVEADIIDVAQLVRYSEEEEADDVWPEDSKENIRPMAASSAVGEVTPPPPGKDDYCQRIPFFLTDNRKPHEHTPPPASGQPQVIPSYRRPNFNSCSLFDPDLLAAFQQAVMEQTHAFQELCRTAQSATKGEGQKQGEGQQQQEEEEEEEEEFPCKVPRMGYTNNEEEEGQVMDDHLGGFELKCPPGGNGAVVLYTTSLRGIRKTFEDCNSVRFLLCSLRVVFHERDLSMHLGYREELWQILGGRAIPPRLFIKGRYIGGADEVLGLHEQGQLMPLLWGMPVDLSGGVPCKGCGGIRFMLCTECSGSRKMYQAGSEEAVRCPQCNENGLVVCKFCCRRSSSSTSSKEEHLLAIHPFCVPAVKSGG